MPSLQRPAWVQLSQKLSLVELIAKLNRRLGQLFTTTAALVSRANLDGAFATKTAAYTATSSDRYVRVDATAGAVTVTLPAAVSVPGHVLHVKKVDASANAVTVDAAGAETIDGALTKVLAAQWAVLTIVSNGTSWDVLKAA